MGGSLVLYGTVTARATKDDKWSVGGILLSSRRKRQHVTRGLSPSCSRGHQPHCCPLISWSGWAAELHLDQGHMELEHHMCLIQMKLSICSTGKGLSECIKRFLPWMIPANIGPRNRHSRGRPTACPVTRDVLPHEWPLWRTRPRHYGTRGFRCWKNGGARAGKRVDWVGSQRARVPGTVYMRFILLK